MELVRATEDDVPALVERWYALATEMERYSRFNELRYESPAEVPRDAFRSLLADDATTVYRVVVDGDDRGFLTLREGEHPSRTFDRYVRLVDLFVDESHRRQGLGTAVIDRVRELARERGVDHLKVACEWDNEGARRLYEREGFEAKRVTYVQALE